MDKSSVRNTEVKYRMDSEDFRFLTLSPEERLQVIRKKLEATKKTIQAISETSTRLQAENRLLRSKLREERERPRILNSRIRRS